MSPITSLGVEPIDNGWDTLVRTHQGEKQVKHAALLLYTDRLARECGWQTVLTPQVECVGFHPDLWIDAGDLVHHGRPVLRAFQRM